MKKGLIIAIICVILVILVTTFLTNGFSFSKETKLVANGDELIKGAEIFSNIVFEETKVVEVGGRTMLTTTIKNNSNEDFNANKIIFKLIDFSNNVIAESSKQDIFITATSERLYNITFDKIYDNIYDIQYVIE